MQKPQTNPAMLKIPGYQILNQIYESANSLVYRGRQQLENRPAIVKLLKQDYPTIEELRQYRREYEILRTLDIEGAIAAYELLKYENTLGIVLEDFGGESLKELMRRRQFTLEEFLRIAIAAAESLGNLHGANIIHKDINPSNIVYNPATEQLKLIDFGISTPFDREDPIRQTPTALEGTIAYMSPEQTGRMNRSLDLRTDFYSLGVTFYELLTGQLPFETSDAMELVHCHLAKRPVPPHELNSEIPKAVSNIVMKLLAKIPERRYQSAWGLYADLENCLTQLLGETKMISEFPLGSQDISDNFQIPKKLYGRERDIETLLAAVERVSGRSSVVGSRSQPTTENLTTNKVEMMLVTGYAGIGKSALVQEIYQPITRGGGYFISGKFDQFQHGVPYSGIVKVFSDLVRQLLTEPETRLAQWREKILAASGVNAQVIIDVIPEVEMIVGKQAAVVALAPVESQNRFNFVFQNFIRVFGTRERPLVIFLDDLQWADLATLKLIERMMADDGGMGFLLLIGAYRDNEVSPTHPLTIAVEAIRKSGTVVNQIHLKPLPLEPITHLVARALNSDFKTVKSLAELVLRKTGGNPFFVNQFLSALYEEKLLAFSWEKRGWQWDIEEIEAIAITDNVVELMLSKLKKLPAATQEVLRLAACVGDRFDLSTLSIVNNQFVMDIFQSLVPAIESGLILSIPNLDTDYQGWDVPLLIVNYQFLHDRVQQAAYALIEDDRKKAVHLQIGRLLRSHLSPAERGDRIFELVDHLNLGREAIADELERVDVARLNLSAGKKAKESTAYTCALQYFVAGAELLTNRNWETDYDLTFTLYKEWAELEYLNGNFERSESLIGQTMERATSATDKAELYRIDIVKYTTNADFDRAVQSGRKAIALLGIDLPDNNLQGYLDVAFSETRKRLGNREIAKLLDTPEAISTEDKLAIQLLNNLLDTAYLSKQLQLFFIITLKIVNLSLDSGITPESACGFSCYGMLLGTSLCDYKSGYEFGNLALNLSKKFDSINNICKAYFILGNDLTHWVKPLRESEAIFQEGYRTCLESGEFQLAGCILIYKLLNSFYQSKNIQQIQSEIPQYLQGLQSTKYRGAIAIIQGLQLILSNLSRLTESSLNFDTQELRESYYLECCISQKNDDALCHYYSLKSLVIYLYGNPEQAIIYSQKATAISQVLTGKFQLAENNFYESLSLAAIYLEASAAEQKQYWEKLTTNQKQMKIWADNCPDNFWHKYLLVEAEMARLGDRELEAMKLYDRAISLARKGEFIQTTALANELTAKFWLSKGKDRQAKYYLIEAYYGYQFWGAKRKAEELELHYPQFIFKTTSPARTIATDVTVINTVLTTDSSSRVLDIASVMKASQAISSEILFDRLLGKLLNIMIENAGANLGYLILERTGKLFVEAVSSIRKKGETVPLATPVEASNLLPLSVVNYVARTRENVVLNEATKSATFARDPYIQLQRSKSLLCTPIVDRGKLIGLLYLENDLIAGAFTSDRLEVLQLLCSQAAISIENARLYQNLQQSEAGQREKTQQLRKSLEQLKQAQIQLVQIEKMSALGQMMAGVAHEINNPVCFIGGNLKHAREYIQSLIHILHLYQQKFPDPGSEIEREIAAIEFEYIKEDLPHLISSMQIGIDRIRNISTSLRTFSRSDIANKTKINIHESIDSTLTILKHRLKANQKRPAIQVIKNYGNLPLVECYVGQLNQVFMNIIANAIEAVDESNYGRSFSEIEANPNAIRIKTEVDRTKNSVTIRIKDNGLGMSDDVKQQIFDHLFTTKPVGKGTGLGLSISRQIVEEQHGGTLSLISELRAGAEFVIELPLH